MSRRTRSLALGLALAVATLILVVDGAAADEPTVRDHGPILQMPGPHSIVVRWWTAEAGVSVVQFAPEAGGPWRSVHDLRAVHDHVAPLDGLAPGTAYRFRVYSLDGDRVTFARSGRFRTLPAGPEVTLRCVLLGGADWSGFEEEVEDADPHLLLASSPSVGASGASDWEAHYERGAAVASQAALLRAVGRGAYEGTGMMGTAILGHLNDYKRRHTLPGNEEWYSLRCGQVEFYFLDAAWYADPTRLLLDQRRWLDEALRAATDGVDDPRFKVIVTSAPAPGAAADGWDMAEELWATLLVHRLAVRRGVDLIVSGSGNHSEIAERRGLLVAQTATGRPAGRAPMPRGPLDAATGAETLHFREAQRRAMMRVEASGDTLRVAVVDESGRILAERTLRQP